MYEAVLPFSVNVANVLKFIVLELVLLPLVTWSVDLVNSKTNWNGILGGHLRVRKDRFLFPVSRLNVRLGFLLPLVILGLTLAAEFGFGSRSSETAVTLRGLQKLTTPNDTLDRVSEIESIVSACLPERASSGFESSRPLVVNASTGICVEVSEPGKASVEFRSVWQGQTEATGSDKLDSISFGQLPQAGPAVLRGTPTLTSTDDFDNERIFSGFRSEDPRFERGALCRATVLSPSGESGPTDLKLKVSECMIWGSGGVRISAYQPAGSFKCTSEELDPFKCAARKTSGRQAVPANGGKEGSNVCCNQDLSFNWPLSEVVLSSTGAPLSEVVLSSTGEAQLWVDVKVTSPEATFGVLAGREAPFFIDQTEWQGRIAALVVAINELEVADLEVRVNSDDERATINVLGLAATGAIVITALLLMIIRLVLGCFIEGNLDLGVADVLDRWFDEAADLRNCANPGRSDRTLKLVRTKPNTMHISITGTPRRYDGVSRLEGE